MYYSVRLIPWQKSHLLWVFAAVSMSAKCIESILVLDSKILNVWMISE